MTKRTYSNEEVTRQGRTLYEEHVRPNVDEEADRGKFVAIDVETGDYEVSGEKRVAGHRLKERRPEAPMYFTRIGLGYAHHLGARPHR